MLSAIRHFARITLFILSTPPEAQLSTCLDLAYRQTRTSDGNSQSHARQSAWYPLPRLLKLSPPPPPPPPTKYLSYATGSSSNTYLIILLLETCTSPLYVFALYHLRRNFFKPRPLLSEKLAFGCALFSNMESDTGMIQKTIIASFVTCCCTSYRCSCINYPWTSTDPSTYINTVKEGGLSLPSSCEGGGGGGLQPP